MLILTRRIDESIMLGDDIKITILRVGGNQVHIGIEAPDDVVVNREEVHQRIQAEEANGNK